MAILSPVSKILERIIYDQVYSYFSKNMLFHHSMHGYRRHRSTQTALLSLFNRLVTSASEGKLNGVMFLDLSAAFDLVSHEMLIKKLSIYRLDKGYLTWLESYLSDRFQSVWIDHVYSDFLPCQVGVPQGSILGPLLFMIYFNDLFYHIPCSSENYADDTTITTTGVSIREISEKLSRVAWMIVGWMKSNMLKLNPTKTHIMTVGTEQKLRIFQERLEVNMDGVVLKEDPDHCEVLLGCHIKLNLKWSKHFDSLMLRLKKRIAGLTKLKYIVPFNVRKVLAEGLFNSVMIYCLPVFGGTEKGNIRQLQVLQNKVLQIVCHAPPRANRVSLLNKLGWLSVNQIIAYHTLLAIFKMKRVGEPEYLAGLLNRESRNGRIFLPNFQIEVAQRSFLYRGSSLWNSLPFSVRKLSRIGHFKRSTREWILANVPRFMD